MAKRFGQIRVLIRIKSEAFNPQGDLSEDDSFFNAFMQNMGQAPTWSYRNGENRIAFTFVKKHTVSDAALNIGAILLGIIMGLVLKRVISPEAQSVLCESYLNPVNDAIMGILSGASIFFIFFSIISGICNMGDIATFNRIGKKIFSRIIVIMVLSTVICCLLFPLFHPLTVRSGESVDTAGLWQTIVNIIPTNFVNAFLSQNSLQVSFLSIVIGIIILILGEKGKNVSSLVSDISNIISKLLQGIIWCLPISVFISIFEQILMGDAKKIVGFYKYPLYVSLLSVALAALFVIRVCILQKLSVKTFLGKIKPVMLIALATSSSSATVTESYKICEEKLGIDKQMIHFGWPINSSFIGFSVLFDGIIACLVSSMFFQTPVSISMLISLGLNACILSMALPKIPGTAIMEFTLLLGLLRIPTAEALAMLVPLQIVTDRILTCMNCIVVHTELIQQADQVDLLDKEVLHRA